MLAKHIAGLLSAEKSCHQAGPASSLIDQIQARRLALKASEASTSPSAFSPSANTKLSLTHQALKPLADHFYGKRLRGLKLNSNVETHTWTYNFECTNALPAFNILGIDTVLALATS